MGFSYKPLFKRLIEEGMTKEDLRTALNLSPSTMAKMGRGEKVSLDVIGRICGHFNCRIEDVVEYVPDDK